MKSVIRKRTKGFTLVELLIVVAIIGVLATIGVPTFRRMVQKAKKSEAKVGLGALYTSEAAFFAEYGTYGDNIQSLGFELDGTATNRIYHQGFVNASCSQAASVAMPASTNTTGSALMIAFPSYYTGTYVGAYFAGSPNNPTSCLAATTTAGGTSFIATATGRISPNLSAPNLDQWQIDQTRTLANVQDGTF